MHSSKLSHHHCQTFFYTAALSSLGFTFSL